MRVACRWIKATHTKSNCYLAKDHFDADIFCFDSDQRGARWFRTGAPSCVANLSVPFKQASHCLLVSRKRSETHEEGMGRQGGKATPVHYWEEVRSQVLQKYIEITVFFTKVWVQSPPAVLSLEGFTPDPDLSLSLLLGSSDSCAGILFGYLQPEWQHLVTENIIPVATGVWAQAYWCKNSWCQHVFTFFLLFMCACVNLYAYVVMYMCIYMYLYMAISIQVL